MFLPMRATRPLSVLAALALLVSACSSPGATAAPQATGAASAPAPASASAGPPTAIKFTFDWKPADGWMPLLAAEEQGYFAEANLEVEFTEGNGASDAIPLIGTRAYDIGQLNAPPLLLSIEQEVPVTAIGVIQTGSPNVLLCDPEKVKAPKDMENGVSFGDQPGEFEHAIWLAWAKANNVDVSKVNVLPATGQSDQEFIAGQLDCYIDHYTSGAMVPLTEAHPGEETQFLIRDSLTLYGLVLVANNDFLAENPDGATRFLAAWAQGMKWTIDNPAEAEALLIAKYPELFDNDEGRAITKWNVEKSIESWISDDARASGLLSFSADGWTATKDAIVGAGLTNGEDIDISKIYTDQYLPDPPVMP